MSQNAESIAEVMPPARSSKNFPWAQAVQFFLFSRRGGLPAGIYSFLRNLIPVALLYAMWLRHSGSFTMFATETLRARQFSFEQVALLVGIALSWKLIGGSARTSGLNNLRGQLWRILKSGFCCATLLLIYESMYVDLLRASTRSACFLVVAVAADVLLLSITCLVHYAFFIYFIEKQPVVIVGSGKRAQSLFRDLENSPHYDLIGIVDDEFIGDHSMKPYFLGNISQLEPLMKAHPVQVVYCTLPLKSNYEQAQEVISICEMVGVEVRHSARLFQTNIAHFGTYESNHGMFSALRMVRLDSSRYVKRAIDIVCASVLLLLVSPVIAVAAIVIKRTDGGPVLFAQDRYGLNRKRFRIYKLRTMVMNAEELQKKYEDRNEVDGPVFKIKDDPRVTSIGSFLRKSSIDELPQLWNVLKGDMSLVGPRPLAVRDVTRMDHASQLRRFSVPPGITCVWQISGRNNTDFDTWLRQDLEYIDHWSLLLDLSILLRTIPAVLWGRGAM